MKKFLYTLFLSIATISYLAVAALSHHHHEEMVCMTIEHCSEGGNLNDKNDKNDGAQDCPLDASDFVTASKIHHSHDYGVLDFIAGTVTYIFSINECKAVKTQNQYVSPVYIPSHAYAAMALRAPPTA